MQTFTPEPSEQPDASGLPTANDDPLFFTEEALSQASGEFAVLGPAYFDGRRVAEAFMAKFEVEHLKPMVDKFAESFRDAAWSDFETFLLGDTESNLTTSIMRMVDATVNALLTGERWAIERYPYDKYDCGKKVRKAIFDQCGADLADRRIADLEDELARTKEAFNNARRY